MNLALSKAIPFLKSLNGQMFSVEFTKKNGDLRKMSCRLGVKKGIKGTGTYSHTGDTKRNNLSVFEMANGGQRRAVPLDRVISLKAQGQVYSIV